VLVVVVGDGLSGSFIAFFFVFLDFATDVTSFSMPAFLSGEACGTAGVGECLLGVGVGACSVVDANANGFGASVDANARFIALDGDDDDSFGVRRTPPLRDGDLKTEAAAASC
jgi:hypothetical protein